MELKHGRVSWQSQSRWGLQVGCANGFKTFQNLTGLLSLFFKADINIFHGLTTDLTRCVGIVGFGTQSNGLSRHLGLQALAARSVFFFELAGGHVRNHRLHLAWVLEVSKSVLYLSECLEISWNKKAIFGSKRVDVCHMLVFTMDIFGCSVKHHFKHHSTPFYLIFFQQGLLGTPFWVSIVSEACFPQQFLNRRLRFPGYLSKFLDIKFSDVPNGLGAFSKVALHALPKKIQIAVVFVWVGSRWWREPLKVAVYLVKVQTTGFVDTG